MPFETHIWSPQKPSGSNYELESLPGSVRFKILAEKPGRFVIPGAALAMMPPWQHSALRMLIDEQMVQRNRVCSQRINDNGDLEISARLHFFGLGIPLWWI